MNATEPLYQPHPTTGIHPVSSRREACLRAVSEPFFAATKEGKFFLVCPTQLKRADRLGLRILHASEIAREKLPESSGT